MNTSSNPVGGSQTSHSWIEWGWSSRFRPFANNVVVHGLLCYLGVISNCFVRGILTNSGCSTKRTVRRFHAFSTRRQTIVYIAVLTGVSKKSRNRLDSCNPSRKTRSLSPCTALEHHIRSDAATVEYGRNRLHGLQPRTVRSVERTTGTPTSVVI